MGIHPHETWQLAADLERWVRTIRTPGLTVIETYQRVERTEVRDDCFCCSCPEEGGPDAACRNHGYYGRRPCEEHGLPGYPWENTTKMPDSVQAERARLKELNL